MVDRQFHRVGWLLSLAIIAMPTFHAQADDIVIMKDGFVLEGRWFRESELVMDTPGRPVRISKANGFDVVENGPKFTIFSSHAKRGGQVETGVDKTTLQAFKMPFNGTRSRPLPTPVLSIKSTPFDENWKRTLRFNLPQNQFELVKQRVIHIDPNTIGLQSTTHSWRLAYHTKEWNPNEVIALLRNHPDLKDVDGKVDPDRRLKLAEFIISVDWPLERVKLARAELARLVKDYPKPWSDEVQKRFDNVNQVIDQVEGKMFADEMAVAVKTARYNFARILNGGFRPKSIAEDDSLTLTKARAELNTLTSQYDDTLRHLTALVEAQSGMGLFTANCALAGCQAGLYFPRPNLTPEKQKLLNAASTILQELHPDTVDRISHFTRVAAQEENRREKGLSPTASSDQLIALAITGWLNGKNGWDENVAVALRHWDARQMMIDYLHGETRNDRYKILDDFQSQGGDNRTIGPDVLAQMVPYLPPPFAEELAHPKGELIPKERVGIDGIRTQSTTPSSEYPDEYDYFVHLPPEYHHGRSYPVIIALGDAQFPAEQMMAFLTPLADRHGYILASPEWSNQFSDPFYDFSGKFHARVTATLHDLRRRYQVDSDRVFLWGQKEGANFALDVGMAHPDLFAGVVANAANPPTQIFAHFWKNAQKLPIYIVNGEISGAFTNLRRVFEKWTVAGFPALLTIYKGRGAEQYGVEQPRIFDWMSRKTRARGTASLRLSEGGFVPWQILRDNDSHRFYWVGVAEDGLTRPGWQPGDIANPAQFRADIRRGIIEIDQAVGINKFIIWLERDLIDWEKPIVISVNGRKPSGYKPEILKPDPRVMLEELHRTGDRKMLYLGKIEVRGPG